MSVGPDYYPTRDETVAYMRAYEQRYALPVQRPAARSVQRAGNHLAFETDRSQWPALSRIEVETRGKP